MSNPDKHKPLSAKELFKLLDNQSGRETDFENMDDFEKDAFEGFTKHSTIQKAETLTEELNLAISKRVIETEGKGGTKNRIIWFSAAASIALIILISIFFFNQTKQDLETNITLNETKEDKKPTPFVENSAPLETETPGISNPIKEEDIRTQVQTKSPEGTIIKNAEGESAAGVKYQEPITLAENKPEFGYEKAAKDEAKSRNENDDFLQNQADALRVKTDTKKKEKSSLDQEEVTSELSLNQNVTTATFNIKEENYKADQDKTEVSKNLEKERATRETVASDKANVSSGSYAKSAPAPSSVSVADNKINGAYYTGSELAIKNYVLSYLKSKQSLVTIAGTYKISGSVSVEGKLKISSMTQITKVNCNCEAIITEALNTMTEWNPAIEGGKNVSSNVEFTIQFN